MSKVKEKIKKWSIILAWGLYDLANQFFALNVVSLYFARWLTIEKAAPEIFYSISFAISTFFVAILSPLLGTISDLTQRRRPFLVYFTLLSIIFTIALGLHKSIFLGLVFFAIANFGCQLAVVFYNALMVNVATREKIGLVSGIGRMLGYSGAILALYLIKPTVLKSGYQATFLPTGILFFIFSLPCMLFVRDRNNRTGVGLKHFLKKQRLKEVLENLKTTCFDTYRFPGLLNFLKAAFFCLCAVNVIILFMSVYATRVFGLSEIEIINLVAFSTIFAIAGSFISGFLSDYFGHKRSMAIVFILWGICFSSGAFLKNTHLYLLLGALVGMALSSTWVVLRALALHLVPPEKTGEVFGLFNFVGYLSGIAGSLFWGAILLFLSSWQEMGYRISLFSLNLFIVFAFVFLLRIDDKYLAVSNP